MHLHPDEALFGGRRTERAVIARLGLLAAALALNLALARPGHVAVLALAGALFIVAERGGRVRLAILAATVALVGATWGVFALAGLDRAALALPALRWIGGTAWALWFGIGVSYGALSRALSRLGMPASWVEVLDLAVAQGLHLSRELQRRRDAAAVRLGLARPWQRVATYGAVVGGGVVQMFDRGAALEEARALRVADRPAADAAPAAECALVELRAVGVCSEHERPREPEHPTRGHGLARLDDVSVALPPGPWVALAGPSGSGKTTLLRVAAGLCRPTHGELLRFGQRVDGARLADRVDGRVGMVFQDPEDQFFAATALEDLVWGLAQRGLRGEPARERALAVLADLGIEHLAERPVHRASFGERKRLALATALVGEPEILLCDEPTMGLDRPAARRVIEALERAAAERGATVVWATHDLEALPERIGHVWLLREGRLVFDGPRQAALTTENLERAGLVE